MNETSQRQGDIKTKKKGQAIPKSRSGQRPHEFIKISLMKSNPFKTSITPQGVTITKESSINLTPSTLSLRSEEEFQELKGKLRDLKDNINAFHKPLVPQRINGMKSSNLEVYKETSLFLNDTLQTLNKIELGEYLDTEVEDLMIRGNMLFGKYDSI